MESPRSTRAFSLIELIVVIAVIAVLAGVVIWHTSGLFDASRIAADRQNVNQWNSSYSYVMGSDPSFAVYDWSNASSQLAAGVRIIVPNGTTITSPVPEFHNSEIVNSFVPGQGLTWNN
jgi:prepilin-type N-terminal cleavage/methylation domain-containing protein